MKKFYKLLIGIITVAIMLSFFGCGADIKYDKLYTEYVFMGSEGLFIESGRTLILYKDDKFTLQLDKEVENLELNGVIDHLPEENRMFLDCDENTTNSVKERYKNILLNELDYSIDIEVIDQLLASVTISEEIRYDKGYLYSPRFITAHRFVDTSLYVSADEYAEFEGVYFLKGSDQMMMLKHGKIYVQDPIDPKVGEFPEDRGSYIYANNFVTMSIVNADGEELPEQKYLVADLILPHDYEIEDATEEEETDEGSSEWYDALEGQLEDLAGKRIKVLVICFYSLEEH